MMAATYRRHNTSLVPPRPSALSASLWFYRFVHRTRRGVHWLRAELRPAARRAPGTMRRKQPVATTVSPSTAQYEEIRSRIQTAIAFPVTPFKADYSLDIDGVRALARFMVDGGIQALVTAGGTGELYNLDTDEWRAVVRATVEEVKGRAVVIAGVGFNGYTGAQQARAAAEIGADALLIFPPYYRTSDEDGLFAYYKMIAGATELPIIPYSRDNAVLGPRIAERIAA